MNKKVKKQHYVPRFYLNNFTSSDDNIFVYDKVAGKVFNTGVKNIACERYFYDSVKFENEQYLEKHYSLLESEFALFYSDFISKIESSEKENILKSDKKIFSRFLVLQIDRTKEYREMSK